VATHIPTNYYNTEDEVERVATAVEELVAGGAR
jgi:hypothetical protein